MPDTTALRTAALRTAGPTALDALPATADGRTVWAELGREGMTASAYRDGNVASGICPKGLGRLLAAVDERFSLASTLSSSVQLGTALPLLAVGTGPAQSALADVVTGRAAIALAATDSAAAGTDLAGLQTEVRLPGAELEVNGGKNWITNATTAEHFLVLARHRPGRHFTHFTWVLVPATAPGVTVSPADSTLFTDAGVGHVTFEQVRLERSYQVGRTGFGLPLFARHISTERLASGLWGVALCRRVLTGTYTHLTERGHGEGTLWDNPGIQQRYAACLVRVRELCAPSAELGERVAREHDTAAAAALKAAAGEVVSHVLGECAQLWGAAGFASGGAQELRAQAALFGIGGGSTEVVLDTVAEHALPVLADLTPWRE